MRKSLFALPFMALALVAAKPAPPLAPVVTHTAPAAIAADPANRLNIELSSGGTVVIQLRPDIAPNHVYRIQSLASQGFYNGLTFHRVIPGFMAQGGDPKGVGSGGSNLPNLTAEFSGLPHMRGVMAMAGFTHRFLATSRKLKSCIASGRLGRIDLAVDRLVANALGAHAPAWYRDRALAGGGIAMIGMIHAIDRLRWLLDAEITGVVALTRMPAAASEVEGSALAMLEFSNGAQASLVAHRSPVKGHERSHRYEIYGEKLIAHCSVGSFALQELELVGPGGDERETVTDDRPFVAEIQEFTSALIAGRKATPDLLDAEIALGVVLAIYESAKTRQPIGTREFIGDISTLSPA